MMAERILLKDPENRREYFELKKYLRTTKDLQGRDPLTLWRALHRMRNDLLIPQHIPIQDVLKLFKKMEEIRKVFELPTISYSILNELYVEIVTIRDMLNLSEDTSLKELLSKIKVDQIPRLGIGKDSLLERLLLIYYYR